MQNQKGSSHSRQQSHAGSGINPRPGDGRAPDPSAVEDWRELARRIQNETDSRVMMDLIQELIAKLDEEKIRRKSAGEK